MKLVSAKMNAGERKRESIMVKTTVTFQQKDIPPDSDRSAQGEAEGLVITT